MLYDCRECPEKVAIPEVFPGARKRFKVEPELHSAVFQPDISVTPTASNDAKSPAPTDMINWTSPFISGIEKEIQAFSRYPHCGHSQTEILRPSESSDNPKGSDP